MMQRRPNLGDGSEWYASLAGLCVFARETKPLIGTLNEVSGATVYNVSGI
jgi:hypothetical protein